MKASVSALLLAISCFNLLAEEPTFRSPAGRFSIELHELAHRKFSDSHAIDHAEGYNRPAVDHVKYSITFRARSNGFTATAHYTDVYGWHAPPAKPSPLAKIVEAFTWSPNEDFVVLPEEQWIGEPRPPHRIAITLDTTSSWKTAALDMELTVWVDDHTVVGNSHYDCDYRVSIFNGYTGKQRSTPRRAQGSVGYSLVAMTPSGVLVKTVLDNCGTTPERQHFIEKCAFLNVGSLSRTPTTCPVAAKSTP